MSGLKSKRRGYRGEIMLRDYLRLRGWKAERVVLSGGHVDHPGDVKAIKDDKTILFEVKNHTDTFAKIYELYDSHIQTEKDDLLSFVCPGEPKLCIDVSTSLDAVLEGPEFYTFRERYFLYPKYKRQFDKLAGMQKFVKGSDILALKDDRRPFLFIRYR